MSSPTGSKGGPTACTGGYKGIRAVRLESEFGMSRRIKPKEKYVRISMKEIWHNLDSLSKNKELWSYVVKFELVGRK